MGTQDSLTESIASAPAARLRAYSYVRFSTPEQGQGDSFRRQIERARSYAARHDLDLDETFRDEGVSAFKGKNRKSSEGALNRFVDRVKSGEVPRGSYLLIESLDRLSREEVLDALEFFMSLMRLGLTVVTIGDSERAYSRESLRDHLQLLLSIFVMARAYEESATKSDRVGRAWAAKRNRAKSDGQAMTARCPAWMQLVGGPKSGHYELIADRAAMVRSWFDKTVSGLGRRSIARDLNARHIATWGQGKLWHDSYIQKTLSNPATYGAFAPRGKLAGGDDPTAELIEGYFPAVVDEPTFRMAQAVSQARGARSGSTSPMNRNLLRGLAKCELCGSNMVYIDKGKRSRPALKCGRAHQSAGCENSAFYRYRDVEIGVIFGLGKKRGALRATAVDALRTAEDAVMVATSRRDEKKATHERLVDLYLGGVAGTKERLQASTIELAALDKEVADAEAARDRARLSDPDVDIADIDKIYNELARLPAEEKIAARAAMHEKLGRMVEKVVLGPSGVVFYYRDGTMANGDWIGERRPGRRGRRGEPGRI